MSRLITPTEFFAKTILFALMKAKHVADGMASILTPYLTENGINLTADEARVAAAKLAHKDHVQFGKDAEKLFKERDSLFKPVFIQHRKCVQNLKSLYKNNISKLGDWGVTVNGNKIVYPVKVEEKIAAVVSFINYHLGLPAGTSPLEVLLANNPEIVLTTNKTNAQTALTHHNDATQLNIDKETKRGDRDAEMDLVEPHVTGIGGFIMDTFPANPNKAGDWGYVVDNSPKGSIVRNGLINFNSAKVLTKLVQDGVLVNESEFDIELYKGKTVSGTAITLKPGKPFVITSGYGTVTLKNPNDEKKAAYQGVFHK